MNRKDAGGEYWHLLVGAAVGMVSQFIFDVGYNMYRGESFVEALHCTSSWADYGAAALSGALAASGVGVIGSIAGNAGISSMNYLTNCEIEGKKGTAEGLLASATIGGLTGYAGGKGANGAKLRGIYSRANEVLDRVVSPKRIAQYTAKKTVVKMTVAKESFKTMGIGVLSNIANKGAVTVIGYIK